MLLANCLSRTTGVRACRDRGLCPVPLTSGWGQCLPALCSFRPGLGLRPGFEPFPASPLPLWVKAGAAPRLPLIASGWGWGLGRSHSPHPLLLQAGTGAGAEAWTVCCLSSAASGSWLLKCIDFPNPGEMGIKQ